MRQTLFVFAAGAIVGLAGSTIAQQARDEGKRPEVKVISTVDIAEAIEGEKAKATTIEITFQPGAAGTPHRHPGSTFGYVLEGEMEFAVGDQKPRILKAGDTFYEPSMALHSVSRNPSEKTTTRVLAIHVQSRDAKELAIPEPPTAEK